MLNYWGIIEGSVIELTVYALDGLIYGLCASKYGFVCMWFCNNVIFEWKLCFDHELKLDKMAVSGVSFYFN